MRDLAHFRRLRLHRRPVGHGLATNLVLRWNYRFPRLTKATLEGQENPPRDRSVYLAMKPTDRRNDGPFQCPIDREGLRFRATWVVDEAYEDRLTGASMNANDPIPLPSRGDRPPLTREDSLDSKAVGAEAHEGAFAAHAVMDHINALVDPEYQFGVDGASDGVSGQDRFV
jgi:hypothetical protein